MCWKDMMPVKVDELKAEEKDPNNMPMLHPIENDFACEICLEECTGIPLPTSGP